MLRAGRTPLLNAWHYVKAEQAVARGIMHRIMRRVVLRAVLRVESLELCAPFQLNFFIRRSYPPQILVRPPGYDEYRRTGRSRRLGLSSRRSPLSAAIERCAYRTALPIERCARIE